MPYQKISRIVLGGSVRCFFQRDPNNPLIYNSGHILKSGDELDINEELSIKFYDHGELDAIAFRYKGVSGFFLKRELDAIQWEKKIN